MSRRQIFWNNILKRVFSHCCSPSIQFSNSRYENDVRISGIKSHIQYLQKLATSASVLIYLSKDAGTQQSESICTLLLQREENKCCLGLRPSGSHRKIWTSWSRYTFSFILDNDVCMLNAIQPHNALVDINEWSMTSSVIPHFVRVSLHPWNNQSGDL